VISQDCDFAATVEEGIFCCRYCGHRTRRKREIAPRRNCAVGAARWRLWLRKVTLFCRAVSGWLRSGGEVRSMAEVRRIFTTHCLPCEQFDGAGCRVCGCRVNRRTSAVLNKIRMRSERCPLGKW